MTDRLGLTQAYCLALLNGARAWRRIADQQAKHFGLSEATAYPLVVMSRIGDGIRQNALAEAMGIEGPSLVRLLDHICAAGLVERREDARDKRAKTLHLTKRGVDLTAAIVVKLDEARTRVFASVSEDDLRAALKVLAILDQAAETDAEQKEVAS